MEKKDIEKVVTEISYLLGSLRACDTQATAIQWMKRAYVAMEQAQTGLREGLTDAPARMYFEALSLTGPPVFVHKIRDGVFPGHPMEKPPEIWTPPFHKPPKAFTHKDTVKLERSNADRRAQKKIESIVKMKKPTPRY